MECLNDILRFIKLSGIAKHVIFQYYLLEYGYILYEKQVAFHNWCSQIGSTIPHYGTGNPATQWLLLSQAA